MVNKALLNYIRAELAKGFDINTVKQHLIEHGYSSETVDKAIGHLYTKHHIPKNTVVLIVSIVLSLGLIFSAFLVYFNPENTERLLDVEVDLYSTSLEPGEDLDFNVELTNLGSERRYDINLRYFIRDSKNKVVNSKEQAIAIETTTSKRLSINVPEDGLEGNYDLQVIARYEDQEARASESFVVEKERIEEPEEPQEIEPNCFDNIQNGDEKGVDCGGSCQPCASCPSNCDDDNECTEDYCSYETNYECKHDTIEDCCGNSICEDGEDYENCEKDCGDIFFGLTMYDRIEKIKEIASTDPDLAGDYCKEIPQITYRDNCFVGLAEVTKLVDNCKYVEEDRAKDKCYEKVAEVTNDSKICERISTDSRRDSCYLTFVMNKDYSVCNKITNEYLRNSCNTLSEIQE